MLLRGFGVGFQKKAMSALLAAVHLGASTVPGEHNSNAELFIKKIPDYNWLLETGEDKMQKMIKQMVLFRPL